MTACGFWPSSAYSTHSAAVFVFVLRWRKMKTGTAAAGVRLLGFVWKLFNGSYVWTRECVAVDQGP
jgi:hypothetical protein